MKYLTILSLITFLGCYGKSYSDGAALGNISLPKIKLLMADSNSYYNTVDIKSGHTAILFYFSPSCPFCRAELTSIIENMESFKNTQICMFTNATFGDFKNFYTEFKLNQYPNIKAGIDDSKFFADSLNVREVPYTVVYGKEKSLAAIFQGRTSAEELKVALDK
jgi:thiol-disulfide isomerase/thioredoxin